MPHIPYSSNDFSILSSYENGTVSPSNEVFYDIAKQYHVSLDWLFGINSMEMKKDTYIMRICVNSLLH